MFKKILAVLVVIAIAGGSIWYFANAWKWDGMYEVQGFVRDQAGEPVEGVFVKALLEVTNGGKVVCDNVATDENGWFHLTWSLIPRSGQQSPFQIDCARFEGTYKLWIVLDEILVEMSPQPADSIIVTQDIVR